MPIIFQKLAENAVIPSYANTTDIGLDLTAIEKKNVLESNVYMYGTGLSAKPPDGYYFELIPRSSIVKSGWMLANSIGVIDPGYTGELIIPLVRINPNMPEIELPFCKAQLVLKPICNCDIIEVFQGLAETSRGSGGFGSTGNRTE